MTADDVAAWLYGRATASHVYSAAGTYAVTATYAGDANYATSLGSKQQTISKASPTVASAAARSGAALAARAKTVGR